MISILVAVYAEQSVQYSQTEVINPLKATFRDNNNSGVVSVAGFGVKVSVMFHLIIVHYTISSVWVTE